MTRDPFEHMKNNNPVPPGNEPSAPMSMAERIVGTRASHGGWPAWALTAVTAAAVLIVGLGSVWLLGGDGGDDVAAGGETTSTSVADTTSIPDTTAASSTTVPVTTDTTVVSGPAGEVAVYLLVDDPTATGVSPALVPVARPLAVLSTSPIDAPSAAVGFLLAGPTPGESSSTPMISTAVPEGTRLLDLTVDRGIATVDLSGEFASGGVGSLAEEARIEQLVYTLTRFDDIDGIRLEIDGAPVSVFGGHGIVLDDPAVRSDLDTLLPAIMIESPAYGGSQDGYVLGSGGMLFATGTANVFEATVSLALTDADGLILWEGFTTASCGTGCRGDWDVAIPYDVDEPQMGSLIAWEESAQNGSQINVREHPVWLTPSARIEGPACSGALVTDSLVEQPDLPGPVAATRAAIFEAAIACDWEALGSLLPPAFTYSFGGGDDPIGFWQTLEFDGEDADPLYHLAELLNRPFGTQPGPDDQSYYAWPSAFVTEWSLVGEADREALRPLYGDEDFAVYEEFGGYIGYRVGILSDGTWVYFVAGD